MKDDLTVLEGKGQLTSGSDDGMDRHDDVFGIDRS